MLNNHKNGSMIRKYVNLCNNKHDNNNNASNATVFLFFLFITNYIFIKELICCFISDYVWARMGPVI